MRYLLACLLLVGCVTTGWYVDRPGFQMKSLEWIHITGDDALQRLHNLCGSTMWRDRLAACAMRVQETGACIVYSIYSEEDSHRLFTPTGETLFQHEVGDQEIPGHCGGGRPDGYTNHD